MTRTYGGLSFTRELAKDSLAWTGRVRGSLSRLDDRDGAFLERRIKEQVTRADNYPITENEQRKLTKHTVNRPDKIVTVSVPEDPDTGDAIEATTEAEIRESAKIQALVAAIGEKMGLSVWIPRSDRGVVAKARH